jgi:hypothetical protein
LAVRHGECARGLASSAEASAAVVAAAAAACEEAWVMAGGWGEGGMPITASSCRRTLMASGDTWGAEGPPSFNAAPAAAVQEIWGGGRMQH